MRIPRRCECVKSENDAFKSAQGGLTFLTNTARLWRSKSEPIRLAELIGAADCCTLKIRPTNSIPEKTMALLLILCVASVVLLAWDLILIWREWPPNRIGILATDERRAGVASLSLCLLFIAGCCWFVSNHQDGLAIASLATAWLIRIIKFLLRDMFCWTD